MVRFENLNDLFDNNKKSKDKIDIENFAKLFYQSANNGLQP